MSESPYAPWIDHHGRLFGLLTADARRMLVSIAHVFYERGYGPEWLFRASDWMVDHDPPTYPTEHLAALKRALADLEGADAARAAAPRPGDEACGLCGDPATGFVLVPHTRPDLMALRRTCVVLCRCPLGRWRRGSITTIRSGGKDVPPPTIEQVEAELPDWRDVLASWKRERAAEDEARRIGGELDRTLGPLVARIRAAARPEGG